MSSKVILTVVQSGGEDKEYVFAERAQCVVGRANCDIPLPKSIEHQDVSRKHCLFEINPPLIRVWDLGSLNGTFVNGKKIGQRSSHIPLSVVDPNDFAAYELRDGDEVQVGQCKIRVGVCNATDHRESAQNPSRGRRGRYDGSDSSLL